MPAALNVDREAVRTLVVAVGPREAAKQLNLPEGTVLAWSSRGKWLADTRSSPAKLPPPASMVPSPTSQAAINAISPSDALKNAMDGRKEKSRLLLSKYVVNAAKVASRSRSPLKDAQNVRHVAAVHSAIWPEATGSSNVVLNLGLSINNVG